MAFLSGGCFSATDLAQQCCVYAVLFGIWEQCGKEIAADQKLAGPSLSSLLENASPRKRYWLATPGGWLAGQSNGTLHVRDQYYRRPIEAAFLKRTAASENALCGANPVRWPFTFPRTHNRSPMPFGGPIVASARFSNSKRLVHSHRIEAAFANARHGPVV